MLEDQLLKDRAMPFGKKYRKAVEGLDLSQRFSVEEAVEKSLGASFAKFDETVDVAIGLRR